MVNLPIIISLMELVTDRVTMIIKLHGFDNSAPDVYQNHQADSLYHDVDVSYHLIDQTFMRVAA